MKNTGGFFELFGVLVLLLVFLAMAIGAYGTIYKANMGQCNYNASGSLINCTLGNYEYNTLNQSATVANETFSLLNYLPYLIGGFVLVGAVVFVVKSF
jgi:hypothetical protein